MSDAPVGTPNLKATVQPEAHTAGLLELLVPLARHIRPLALVPLIVGMTVYGLTHLIKPTFTAATTFMPPQQAQSGAASALASLGALSGLSGATTGLRGSADQYASLLASTTVTDRLIDQFDLMTVYEARMRTDARRAFRDSVRISIGKRDGLISVEVDDTSPQRAADIANRHVDELRRMTSQLALTEAQQRRVFFEKQLNETKDRLAEAQKALQLSGFNAGALRAEPKAAAEGYARLKAESTSARLKLDALSRTFADSAPEIQQQQALVAGLNAQLAQAESTSDRSQDTDYVGKYRDYKYQETLFELFSKQYEMARLDESKEGALIQVVDPALPPERKSKPRRGFLTILAAMAAFGLMASFYIGRHSWRLALTRPHIAAAFAKLRSATGGIQPN